MSDYYIMLGFIIVVAQNTSPDNAIKIVLGTCAVASFLMAAIEIVTKWRKQ